MKQRYITILNEYPKHSTEVWKDAVYSHHCLSTTSATFALETYDTGGEIISF